MHMHGHCFCIFSLTFSVSITASKDWSDIKSDQRYLIIDTHNKRRLGLRLRTIMELTVIIFVLFSCDNKQLINMATSEVCFCNVYSYF